MVDKFEVMRKKIFDERNAIQQRIQLLGVGEKGTNIEAQLQKTLASYDTRLKSLSRFGANVTSSQGAKK